MLLFPHNNFCKWKNIDKNWLQPPKRWKLWESYVFHFVLESFKFISSISQLFSSFLFWKQMLKLIHFQTKINLLAFLHHLLLKHNLIFISASFYKIDSLNFSKHLWENCKIPWHLESDIWDEISNNEILEAESCKQLKIK